METSLLNNALISNIFVMLKILSSKYQLYSSVKFLACLDLNPKNSVFEWKLALLLN